MTRTLSPEDYDLEEYHELHSTLKLRQKRKYRKRKPNPEIDDQNMNLKRCSLCDYIYPVNQFKRYTTTRGKGLDVPTDSNLPLKRGSVRYACESCYEAMMTRKDTRDADREKRDRSTVGWNGLDELFC